MKHEAVESNFLYHLQCPKCGSSDANSMYDDGHQYCHVCNNYIAPDGCTKGGTSKKMRTVNKECIDPNEQEDWVLSDLPARLLTSDTCRKYSYYSAKIGGKRCQVACYYSLSGELVGQKVRYPDKTFRVLGDISKHLYGAHLWSKGKKIVITEGEIDTLTVAQLQNLKWPVVSIPNGAQGAKKTLATNLDYLSNFDEIILMFDMDEPGRDAAKACAELLPSGRTYIANLPLKDPNKCLTEGKGEEVIKAIWSAQMYRPDDIVYVKDVKEDLTKPLECGLPWFLPTLTEATFGRRFGEVYGLGAGTGIGKTDFLTQQIAYDITVLNQKVGTIFLEQKPTETVRRIAGKIKERRFHIPDGSWTQEELDEAVDTLSDRLVLYDSFGQTEWKVVENKIRFMVESEGIRIIYLDHLTAMAEAGNEKDSLEQIMKELAMLANSLSIIITFVSHLATPEGIPHEEGGRVAIRHFKGSRAIGFWSHFMFGMERNQQSEDESSRLVTTLRVLKDRHTGNSTGLTIGMGYDRTTGLLYEKSLKEEEAIASDFM